MGSEDDVCDAYPELLVYSMQMEWIGLNGETYVNSSVRVEWSEGDSRAVCEVPKKLSDRTAQDYLLQEVDFTGHCGRCLVQILAFVTLAVLLLRGLGVQTVRTVPFPPRCGSLSVEPWGQESPRRQRWVSPPERRTRSAAAVLENNFIRPLLAITARWAALGMVIKLNYAWFCSCVM